MKLRSPPTFFSFFLLPPPSSPLFGSLSLTFYSSHFLFCLYLSISVMLVLQFCLLCFCLVGCNS
ncbi:hypothetical protein RchiOBHm_Chr4g0409711 [Rosa chinensis]|uniref:Uncharacterized protein n=1 Tax=Rosa chinensis TaxID=74649 RepID=A0A2P6QV92_ROSCH|nr:hypothetical protein RchiOBHm_Chr4g0409711 [Rosa chinensis]